MKTQYSGLPTFHFAVLLSSDRSICVDIANREP
jgi:hypothetical protein